MSHDLPLANIITLGVSDVAGERDFYRRLGWPLVLDTNDFVVFELRGALRPVRFDDWAGTPTPSRSAAGGIRSSVIITVDRSRTWTGADRRARAVGASQGPVAPASSTAVTPTSLTQGNCWEVAWSAGDNPVTAAARRTASQ